MHLDGHYIAYSEEREEIIEQFHRYIRDRVIPHQGKQEKIKYYIERIQPESFPKNLLVLPPGNKNLQYPNQQGQKQEPVKIIGPARVAYLLNQVIKITCKRILYNV